MGNFKVLSGIVLLVLSLWILSLQEASGKWLMHIGAPLFAVMFFRYLLHVIIVLGQTLPERGLSVFKSRNYTTQIIRGSTSLFASIFIFNALAYLPQAEATAIYFLAPLLVLCAAPMFLGEPSRWYRWVGALVGFGGVMIIVRPGAGLHHLGVIFALLAAFTIAAQFIYTRKLAGDDSKTTLVWTGVVGLAGSVVLLPFHWTTAVSVMGAFNLWEWFVVVLMGSCATLGHLLQIKAYQQAPASLLAPFSYFQIVAAAALGYLIWNQFPDVWAWLGIFVIIGSGVVVMVVEWRNNQQVKQIVEKIIEDK